ncbi:hypothetical protein D3C78_1952560 [compost metagenome]
MSERLFVEVGRDVPGLFLPIPFGAHLPSLLLLFEWNMKVGFIRGRCLVALRSLFYYGLAFFNH